MTTVTINISEVTSTGPSTLTWRFTAPSRPVSPELVREVTEEIIQNLILVRDALSTELMGAWQGDPDEEIEGRLREGRLIRKELTNQEILDTAHRYITALPNLAWDEEMLADAMFVSMSRIGEVCKWATKE